MTQLPDLDLSLELIQRFDKAGPRYTSYPTADRFHTGFNLEHYQTYLDQRSQQATPAPLSIYVHLPFCQSLCYFCACNKIITQDHQRADEYLKYLELELNLVSARLGSARSLVQLHLGGGSPTFFSIEQLQHLMRLLRQHFEFSPTAELGIEIDPRTLTSNSLEQLAELGFNRTSFGLQDLDPAVQAAVNRIQPLAMVQQAMHQSRQAGFKSINLDLIYGLPKQNRFSFSHTLDQLILLAPDRIALYNYAHLPHRFKAQRLITATDLPSAEERLQIFLMSAERLLAAGYQYIGLDHFARPDDELNQARLNQRLQRNFQGYTTCADTDLIGLGLSAISKVGDSYSQSAHSLSSYYQHLDAGRLPVEKGIELSLDDKLRRQVIMSLMCSMPLRPSELSSRYGIHFAVYFADELQQLEPYQQAGLVRIDADLIQVSPKGRLFVRAIAMIFDRYLRQTSQASYSKLI